MGFGANAGSSSRRAKAWNGGSDVIGGATPMGAGASGFASDTTHDHRLGVKCSVSYAIAATSSWRVGSHTPP